MHNRQAWSYSVTCCFMKYKQFLLSHTSTSTQLKHRILRWVPCSSFPNFNSDVGRCFKIGGVSRNGALSITYLCVLRGGTGLLHHSCSNTTTLPLHNYDSIPFDTQTASKTKRYVCRYANLCRSTHG